MNSKRSLTVHYRRLDDPVGAMRGATLEDCIRSALSSIKDGGPLSGHWRRRAYTVPPDHSDTFLMNLYHDDGISFFGDLTVYTKGFLQALLRDDVDVPILSVEQQRPPKGREYIHSMLYWMVIKNHVLLTQGRALNSKHLEHYLTWLLKEQASEIGEKGQVILNAKFAAEELGGGLNDIKEIVVGGTGVLHATSVKDEYGQADIEREKRFDIERERSWGRRALDVLRAIMTSEADVQKLLKSVPDGADLDVSVHIGYKTRVKDITRTPMQKALRNLPDGEVTAIGRDGRQIGSDIRLSYPVRVLYNGSLPDPIDVRQKMKAAYDHFVERGKI